MLTHVRVVEVADSPSVRFAGWMFASSGATVTRLTPLSNGPPGDPWTDGFLDAGKDLPGPIDETRRRQLLNEADVVIADPDFDWAEVADEAGRGAVTGTVDPYGQAGPYANWEASEAVLCSLGGATGYTLARSGTPVYGFGDRYQYLAGVYLYTTLVSCLLNPRTDQDQAVPLVRASALETVTSLLPYPTTQYEYNGSLSVLEQSGPRFICRCTDGFVVVYAGLSWTDLTALLGDPTLTDDPRFLHLDGRFRHVPELMELFDSWCAPRTVAEAVEAGGRHNVAICEVLSPEQVLADPALAGRNLWTDLPDGGRVPQLPYTVNGNRPLQQPAVSLL